MRILWACCCLAFTLAPGDSHSAEPWLDFLTQPILAKDKAADDVVAFVDPRLPALTVDATAEAWEKKAAQLRDSILQRIVYRGQAAVWRDARCRVEWFDPEPGGPGYRLRKLRYEALPDLWIPAVLYEPEQITGRVPVVLNVNGHDPLGTAAPYKQLRCINLAKRGMLALNVEWLGMGQLRTAGLTHGRMNQLDLCGTSGLAPFYLSMKRGLDLLLEHASADPTRVAVAGLSGGGWQTIFISALDTRVTLSNPVAGYSSFQTRLRHWTDLGDSEQTPLDMATVADYTHLTALLAPRPALLTYNIRDNCCFAAGHALPPLLEAARPVYALYGQSDFLEHHVNSDPGDHNFGKDNREAFYRSLAVHFTRPGVNWTVTEIDSTDELRTAEQLQVPMPDKNADFNSLALQIQSQWPAPPTAPAEPKDRDEWLAKQRSQLRQQVVYRPSKVEAQQVREATGDGWKARAWQLKQGTDWTIPVVEITPDGAEQTRILFADDGRASLEAKIASTLKDKVRVLAVDPFYFGEYQVEKRAYLFAMLIDTVGERPLGIQSGQLVALANWAREEFKTPVGLQTLGPRSSVIGLVAAAIEPGAIATLQMHEPLTSLDAVLKKSMSYDTAPELFCAGLLATHDLPLIRQLVAPDVLR